MSNNDYDKCPYDTDSDEYDRWEAARSQQIKSGNYKSESCGWGNDGYDIPLSTDEYQRMINRSPKAYEVLPTKSDYNSYAHKKGK